LKTVDLAKLLKVFGYPRM